MTEETKSANDYKEIAINLITFTLGDCCNSNIRYVQDTLMRAENYGREQERSKQCVNPEFTQSQLETIICGLIQDAEYVECGQKIKLEHWQAVDLGIKSFKNAIEQMKKKMEK